MSQVERNAPRTREDLIQVEYELYSGMLADRLAAREAKFDYWAERWLGTSTQERCAVVKTYSSPLSEAVAVCLAKQVREKATEVRGANVGDAPNWGRLGGEEETAEWLTAFFPAGRVSPAACIVQTWEQHAERHVRVTVNRDDERAIDAYIDALECEARGPSSPWRGKLLEAHVGARGIRFESRSYADLDPGPLWFPDEIWTSFTENVVAALPQLERLERAGLGSNRGVLLVGPPGTGKTALCRWAARELVGLATVVLCSARAGRWLVSQLYEELGYLSPAVVFLEDLDLLVGDRDEGNEREGLIEFLTVLEGLMTRHHRVISVASSNDPKSIDAAAMRAGRFDVVIELGPPTLDARRGILDVYLQRMDAKVDVEHLAAITEGFTGADLREVLRRATLASHGGALSMELLLGAVQAHRFAGHESPRSSAAGHGSYL